MPLRRGLLSAAVRSSLTRNSRTRKPSDKPEGDIQFEYGLSQEAALLFERWPQSEAIPLHLIAELYVREFRVKDATFLADKRPRLRYPCSLRKRGNTGSAP